MQIQQNENSEYQSLILTVRELKLLKPRIDLDNINLVNEPEWNDPQRAEYILQRILDYPVMNENRILLRPAKPIEEYDWAHISLTDYVVGKTGRKELIAFYKYLGLSPYGSGQFSLSQADETPGGRHILKGLKNKSPHCGKNGDPFLANELSKDYFILNEKYGIYEQFLKVEIELTMQKPYSQQKAGVIF